MLRFCENAEKCAFCNNKREPVALDETLFQTFGLTRCFTRTGYACTGSVAEELDDCSPSQILRMPNSMRPGGRYRG